MDSLFPSHDSDPCSNTSMFLDVEEERVLAQRKDSGDLEARDRLVCSCLRLVMHIAKKYQNRGLPWSDLVQEGAMGLLRAVDKFDWQQKTRLTTYATPWIQQTIRRALTQQVSLIRLPERIQIEVWKLASTSAELTQSLGREPTEVEVARYAGLSLNRIDQLRLWQFLTKKELDQSLHTEDMVYHEASLHDSDIEDELERQELYELLKGSFAALDDEEQQILSARYGLDIGEAQTLAQIGAALGFSYEKVRLIEGRALRKLRRALVPEKEE